MTVSEFFGRFVFTQKCPVCGTLMEYERRDEAFCAECRLKWDVAKTKECKACGQSVCECVCMTKTLSAAGALCHHKAVFYSSYEPVAHRTLMFIKRNRNPRVSGFLAAQLASVLEADKELPSFDAENTVITFVPRGRKAVTKHGFDQSMLLVEALSDKTGIPWIRAMRRVRGGREQKKLTAAQRQKNVKGLYEPEERLEDIVAGKCVILVDDVVTTGASMAVCTKQLIRARARSVICLSVATTPK